MIRNYFLRSAAILNLPVPFVSTAGKGCDVTQNMYGTLIIGQMLHFYKIAQTLGCCSIALYKSYITELLFISRSVLYLKGHANEKSL
jgi:hypothetical protein